MIGENIHCGLHTLPLTWNQPNAAPAKDFLTPDIIERCEALFDEAERRVQNDADVLLRVQTVRQEINYYKIHAMPFGDPQRLRLVEQFLAVAKKAGITWIAEHRHLNDEFADELRRGGVIGPAKLAEMGENLLKNAGFEDWQNGKDRAPDGWLSGVRDEHARTGSYSVRLTSNWTFAKCSLSL